jgi:hypothetical protein
LFWGKYETTAWKLANQTRRIFLDFALCARATRDAVCYQVLRYWGRKLYREMWKPTSKSFAEKLEYELLFTSVRVWTILQILKFKLFKKPLYVE